MRQHPSDANSFKHKLFLNESLTPSGYASQSDNTII